MAMSKKSTAAPKKSMAKKPMAKSAPMPPMGGGQMPMAKNGGRMKKGKC